MGRMQVRITRTGQTMTTRCTAHLDHTNPSPRPRALVAAILAVALPALVYLGILLARYDGGPYLRGDCQYYYFTAISLWADGDLDLENQLPPPITRHSADVALDRRGRLVPKHPIWLALAAQPVIITFGAPGALLFNVAQLLLLLFLTYRLATRWASPAAAATSVAATGIASFIPHYVWNFSPDLFLSLLLIAALLILTMEPESSPVLAAIAGLLMGFAGLSKFPAFLAVPGVPLLVHRETRSRLLFFGAGLAMAIAVGGLLNLHLFGSPLTTSYDRIAVIHSDSVGLHTHRGDFDLPIWQGIRGQLLDSQHGLLLTSPITLLSLLGLPALARRDRRAALYVAGTSLAIFLFFSVYRLWSSSHFGNRFLFPLVILAALPLAAGVDRVAVWWRARRTSN
jgi:hypothetical protein